MELSEVIVAWQAALDKKEEAGMIDYCNCWHKYSLDNICCRCNLEKSWQDEIPWDCLIDEIKWVARDRDYGWYGYRNKPKFRATRIMWVSHGGLYSLVAVKMPKGPKEWIEAIARRPE